MARQDGPSFFDDWGPQPKKAAKPRKRVEPKPRPKVETEVQPEPEPVQQQATVFKGRRQNRDFQFEEAIRALDAEGVLDWDTKQEYAHILDPYHTKRALLTRVIAWREARGVTRPRKSNEFYRKP